MHTSSLRRRNSPPRQVTFEYIVKELEGIEFAFIVQVSPPFTSPSPYINTQFFLVYYLLLNEDVQRSQGRHLLAEMRRTMSFERDVLREKFLRIHHVIASSEAPLSDNLNAIPRTFHFKTTAQTNAEDKGLVMETVRRLTAEDSNFLHRS
jgi:hypothetical protein